MFTPGTTFGWRGREVEPGQLLPEEAQRRLYSWDQADRPAGLEHFLCGGTPFRRFDFYHGLARRWFACSTSDRSARLEKQTRDEIRHWDPQGDIFELERLNDRLLRLNVRIEAKTHRRLFRYWHFEGKWWQ